MSTQAYVSTQAPRYPVGLQYPMRLQYPMGLREAPAASETLATGETNGTGKPMERRDQGTSGPGDAWTRGRPTGNLLGERSRNLHRLDPQARCRLQNLFPRHSPAEVLPRTQLERFPGLPDIYLRLRPDVELKKIF